MARDPRVDPRPGDIVRARPALLNRSPVLFFVIGRNDDYVDYVEVRDVSEHVEQADIWLDEWVEHSANDEVVFVAD